MAANIDTTFNSVTLTDSPSPVGSQGIADLARRAADLNQTIRDQATTPNLRKTCESFKAPRWRNC
jgi:hypothetical protein